MELPEQKNLVKKKETTETDTRLIPDIGVNKTIKFGKKKNNPKKFIQKTLEVKGGEVELKMGWDELGKIYARYIKKIIYLQFIYKVLLTPYSL